MEIRRVTTAEIKRELETHQKMYLPFVNTGSSVGKFSSENVKMFFKSLASKLPVRVVRTIQPRHHTKKSLCCQSS